MRLLLAALATFFSLLAPATLHATQQASAPTRPSIEVAIFEGGEGMQFYEECQREYGRLRPEVDVNLYGDPRIDDKLRVRVMEGRTPDLTNAWQIRYHELIQAGRMEPFDAWLDQPSLDTPGKTWRHSTVIRILARSA